jgi:plastocyanin
VVIQEGAGLADSGKGFEPATITVYVGINNTVRWVNQDDTFHFIEADNADSEWFYEATRLVQDSSGSYESKNALEPHDSFELTFEETGEFPYHSKPWNRGKVIVLP